MCIETCAATLIEGLSALCFDKKNEDKTNGFKTPRGGLLNNVVIDFPIMYFSILALLAQLGNRLPSEKLAETFESGPLCFTDLFQNKLVAYLYYVTFQCGRQAKLSRKF